MSQLGRGDHFRKPQAPQMQKCKSSPNRTDDQQTTGHGSLFPRASSPPGLPSGCRKDLWESWVPRISDWMTHSVDTTGRPKLEGPLLLVLRQAALPHHHVMLLSSTRFSDERHPPVLGRTLTLAPAESSKGCHRGPNPLLSEEPRKMRCPARRYLRFCATPSSSRRSCSQRSPDSCSPDGNRNILQARALF
ncbi:hypothetical protein GWK47_038538 [Chionoecetes opilio]|uniref:Uncharacterized protein n=1 Tax=Chionoecetes opilio TaxID=41210 RepID=A0A8J4YE05_CHIOP|nr:hypothetical protein GWK47_038538 [Chionoecetes opilio]